MSWIRRAVGAFLSLALLAGLAAGAAALDGQAVYEKREDTMKQLGKPFYLTIGRAAKGSQPMGPDTIAAAETVMGLTQALQPELFAPGSNVGGSKIKPEIFKEPERVVALTAEVRAAVAKLVPAARSGNKATLATAFAAASQACAGCHKAFRIED
jgi:cytochrome c556